MNIQENPDLWTTRIRIAFWTIGPVIAAVMAYTTRFFINGDAIVYVEMGEALRRGDWMGLVNWTYSPGYPVLLGIGQALLDTNPLNELPWMRTVNFFCFILAMTACELVMHFVRKDAGKPSVGTEQRLSPAVLSALGYGMFLVCSLVFIRIRLVNPDMLVLATALFCAAAILWIRGKPESFLRYGLLGVGVGVGYLVKSFFFPFSPVFFAVAGLCAGSLRKALPRIVVAAAAMIIVAMPLVAALSQQLGRFSYGELGRHIYAKYISGEGQPLYPQILSEKPTATGYVFERSCTRPSGFDICYWHEGLRPRISLTAQLEIIPVNVKDIFSQTPWLVLLIGWFVVAWILGSARFGPIRPPSICLLLVMSGVLGIAFYSLVRMEPRYIAPYLFLSFVGLTTALRRPAGDERIRRRMEAWGLLLAGFFTAMVAHSLIDQSMRGLSSTSGALSYRDAFTEHLAVKDFLETLGLRRGDVVGLVGDPPVYWGRMAGLKINGEIENVEEFLTTSRDERALAQASLKKIGVLALAAKDVRIGTLVGDGWQLVPRTRDYYVLLLGPAPPTAAHER